MIARYATAVHKFYMLSTVFKYVMLLVLSLTGSDSSGIY